MFLEMSYQRYKFLFRSIEWTETQRNSLTSGPSFWVSWMAGSFYILGLLRLCRVEGDMDVTSKLWSMTVVVFSLNQLQSSFEEHCLDCLHIRADSPYWTILRCLVKNQIRDINTCWISMLYHGFFFLSFHKWSHIFVAFWVFSWLSDRGWLTDGWAHSFHDWIATCLPMTA